MAELKAAGKAWGVEASRPMERRADRSRLRFQKENERRGSDRKVTEKKLTVGAVIKIVVFTILALIGFFVL